MTNKPSKKLAKKTGKLINLNMRISFTIGLFII